MFKRIVIVGGVILLALVVVLAGVAWRLHRRALPDIAGTVTLAAPEVPAGPKQAVEILRDRWGVPHIFAQTEEDAAFAQGWATAQDRLFQIELLRRVTQGRVAEMVGKDAVDLDKLHRTLDFHGIGKRMLARAQPRTRALVEAYVRGVNAYAAVGGRMPIEFTLLGVEFKPLVADDMIGIVPYMSFGLMDTWRMEPVYEQLAAKLGPERFARLFPDAAGGPVRAYPASAALQPDLMLAAAAAREQLGWSVPSAGSNNWAVSARKSASGQALLANDPHLNLGLPAIWHTVHLSVAGHDVAGVTIPGLPFITIGHNRDIAWGLTNLMADLGDLFVEKINPADATQVMFRGKWVRMSERQETIAVKGAAPIAFTVRITPHGPLVQDLLKGQTQALALRWVPDAAEDANELDAFSAINQARTWPEFRAAVRGMGGVSQNFAYADRQGNIGVQAGGRIPVRLGNPNGARYRVGWDGSQEWAGWVPFEKMPFSYNPSQGTLATANTPPFRRPAPFYLSSYFEPRDRWLRITELLGAKDKLSAADMQAVQNDKLWVEARALTAKLKEVYSAQPPSDPTERAALQALSGWDGTMAADSAAAAIGNAFFEQLYTEIFSDELGPELTRQIRDFSDLRAVLVRQVLEGDTLWLDNAATPAREGWPEIVRPAFAKAVAGLKQELGGEPASWAWGRLHTFEIKHALGRVRWLAPYFNRGPYPMGGNAMTVAKAQSPGGSNHVNHGPSMRQITDFADINQALVVLPGGESGIPASPHYADDLALWLSGQYHALPLDRAAVEGQLAGRLVLQSAR